MCGFLGLFRECAEWRMEVRNPSTVYCEYQIAYQARGGKRRYFTTVCRERSGSCIGVYELIYFLCRRHPQMVFVCRSRHSGISYAKGAIAEIGVEIESRST